MDATRRLAASSRIVIIAGRHDFEFISRISLRISRAIRGSVLAVGSSLQRGALMFVASALGFSGKFGA